MNYIGIFAPKIVSLLMVLFSAIGIREKGILLALWFLKLVLDYNTAKPGHSGVVYKLTKNVNCEIEDLIVNCILFTPSIIFLAVSIKMQAWLPLIPGAIGTVVHIVLIAGCIKSVIVEGNRKQEINASTNHKW